MVDNSLNSAQAHLTLAYIDVQYNTIQLAFSDTPKQN